MDEDTWFRNQAEALRRQNSYDASTLSTNASASNLLASTLGEAVSDTAVMTGGGQELVSDVNSLSSGLVQGGSQRSDLPAALMPMSAHDRMVVFGSMANPYHLGGSMHSVWASSE
eukprot:490303-Hanusia_phi.AAC.1